MSSNNHEEELEMLVGMGFERRVAKRAMQANSWNMHEALSDLTSGEFNMPDENSSRRSMSDGGLNSLSVPRRSSDDGSNDNNNARTTSRRQPEPDSVAPQRLSPRAQRISEYDITNETETAAHQSSTRSPRGTSSSRRRRQRSGARHRSRRSGGNHSSGRNQSRAIRSEEQKEEESAFDFSEQISWPSAARPNTISENDAVEGQAVLDNSSPNLSNGPSTVNFPGEASSGHMSGFDESFRSNQDPPETPDPCTVTAIATDEEDAAASATVETSYPEYVPRSAAAQSSSSPSKLDFSWCKPSVSFGFLVFIGIILVVPAIVLTLSFLIPREVAPPVTYDSLDFVLRKLLNASSLDGGVAMATDGTPQNRAYNWLYDQAQPHEKFRSFESVGAQIGTLQNGSVFSLPYGNLQTTQRYALATLYFSTGGDNWSTNEGWLSEEDECLGWFHRHTAEFCRGGAIVNLDLSENNLTETLPNELTMLGNTLQSLTLDNNELSGTIPTSIGLLTNLVSLGLSRNQFTGTVPVEVNTKLTRLQYLYLFENSLTPEFTCSESTPFCYVSCNSDDDACRSL